MKSPLIIFFTLTILSSCFLLVTKQDVNALLTNMDPEVKLEIEQIISASSNGSKVNISETAFLTNSLLIIEQNPAMKEKYKNDRTSPKPIHYRLTISDNGQCFIQDNNTKLQWFLFKGQCIAESK